MKRIIAFCFSLLLLIPAVSAMEEEVRYETSPWALADVKKALAFGIIDRYNGGDLRKPIFRGNFAEKATSLVAIEFGSNLESYLRIMRYRSQVVSSQPTTPTTLDMAKNLGIIQGRGDGDWDEYSCITRQEAAVMLARTYRAYQDKMPESLQPISFADQGDIADWALEDVQLMNHLGIMTGVGNEKFDPLGNYTCEQCLVTLLRLHEKAPYDGSKQENPFAIPVWEGGFAKNWDNNSLAFAFETEDYYIGCYVSGATIGNCYYYIEIIDQDLSSRTYPTAILSGSGNRGDYHVRPKNAYISQDGTKLIYTAIVNEDAYRHFYDFENDKYEHTLLFLKGVYTVTMDLKTGEQTYTRADLTES